MRKVNIAAVGPFAFISTMKEKYFLGFSLGFNASAALLSNKRGIVAAISQERLSGNKNTKEIPFDALIACCKTAGVTQIQSLCFSHYQELKYDELLKYAGANYIELVRDYQTAQKPHFELFEAVLNNNNITIVERELKRMNHHESHAASAYAVYGRRDKYIAFTSDGFGDGLSARIVVNTGSGDKVKREFPLVDSVALIYQFVTGALGYKMHQHEGKITGLAAYGKPKYIGRFAELHEHNSIYNPIDTKKLLELGTQEELDIYNASKNVIQDFDLFCRLKKTVFALVESIIAEDGDGLKTTKADIAATVQYYSENRVLAQLEDAIMTSKFDDEELQNLQQITCYLAGGLFANVKINQKIQERFHFKETLVSPPMGDEGTAAGAAYLRMLISHDRESYIPENLYNGVCSGTEMQFTVDDANRVYDTLMQNTAHKDQFEFYYFQDEAGPIKQIEAIAELLTNKKIVCLCHGRMEYGPRALCHRSILYDCTDASTNDWLNKQLGRTEFMPFAPVCLEEDAYELFENYKTMQSDTLRFMTMTLRGTKEFRKNYPAAAHIDGTARPQILHRNDDAFMCGILDEYKRQSGKKVLINTSFNLHNYPIIEDAKTAVNSWLASNTDALVINNILMVRKDV